MKIVIPILNTDWTVIVVCGNEVFVNRALKKHGHSQRLDKWNARGLTYYESSYSPVIALPCIPKTPEEIGTLAHEATHAVADLFTHIGQPLECEVYSHSVGAIVRETLKAIKRHK